MSAVEPEDLYELDSDRPDLTDSVLLQAMDGFVDAGATVKILRDHLRGLGEGRIIARFDVDLLYDYRARRPFLHFDRDHWASFDAPELALHLRYDADGTAFLLLVGPEPDVLWERFVKAVRSIVSRLGVRLTVGVNAFPMNLPHTRPTRVILHGSRPELFEGYRPWLGGIIVPASAGHLLEFRLGQAGHDALGMAAPVPPYVTDTEYPGAAVELNPDTAVRMRRAVEPRMHQHAVEIPARRANVGPIEAEAGRTEIDRAARGAALPQGEAADVAGGRGMANEGADMVASRPGLDGGEI